MLSFIIVCLVFSSVILRIESDVSCTFSHSTKIVKCGNQECSAITNDTPIGNYKLGAVGWNREKKRNWVNLYPKKNTGNGYWDYYCENPDTERSKIALHPGSRSSGCISVPDSRCWSKLQTLFNQQTSKSLGVTGVKRSCWKDMTLYSCDEDWGAGDQITVSVIGSLEVTK